MENDLLVNTNLKMQGALDLLNKELAAIRTGRANPAIIEHIKVEYAGVPTPLNQIAAISAPQANLLVIQPWDRSSLRNIEKAVLTSDLGLNPTNDGNLIRLVIPPLSEERRQELIRMVRNRVEERKVAIRNIRREVLNELKSAERNKEISQDEHKRTRDQLQKLTDTFIIEIETIGKNKEVELTEV
jgi:ribosome recycling factor